MTAQADALMGIFGFKRVEGKAMDKVSETRRGLFEAYVKTANKADYDDRGDDLFKWNGDTYVVIWVNWDYQLWCAALDAVEINLPHARMYPPNEASSDIDYFIDEAVATMRQKCEAAIESTNLGLRIK